MYRISGMILKMLSLGHPCYEQIGVFYVLQIYSGHETTLYSHFPKNQTSSVPQRDSNLQTMDSLDSNHSVNNFSNIVTGFEPTDYV